MALLSTEDSIFQDTIKIINPIQNDKCANIISAEDIKSMLSWYGSPYRPP